MDYRYSHLIRLFTPNIVRLKFFVTQLNWRGNFDTLKVDNSKVVFDLGEGSSSLEPKLSAVSK